MTHEEADIRADGTSVAHIKLEVIDEQGRMVPYADHNVTVTIEGPARLIGMENGDPIDSTHYKLNHRRAFNGMLQAIIQSETTPGTITITATATELKSTTQSIQLK